jgi:autotransporter-associated beta strand protein/adhesin HecA-like repeat protein
MSKLFFLFIALVCRLPGFAQSEQQQFWALNGSYSGFTWDNTSGNNRTDNGSGNWDGSTKNWSVNGGVINILWKAGAAAIFGGNPGTGAAGTVTLSSAQTVQSLEFNPSASGNFTLTGSTITNTSGIITANDSATITSTLAGSSGLTLMGNGVVTINGVTTYTGTTTLNSGTLELANGTVGSTVVTLATPISILSGAILSADITTNINLSGAISGPGTLNLVDAGNQTMRLYGNNSGFTGNFSEPAATRGMMWSDGQAPANAANTGSASASWDLSGSFGFIETAGAATPTVQLGSLSGTTSTTTIGGFGGSGIKTFQIGALNTNTNFEGSIEDNPQTTGTPVIALIKVGTGTLTLSGTNTYTGSTTVNAGALDFTTAKPADVNWNIAENATSAPTSAGSGLMQLPASPAMAGKIVNILLTGAGTGFTWNALIWTGTATGAPTLQINGTTVTSGVASGGTTVTYTVTSGITVKR